jgi:hypothetical protein
MKKGMRNRGRSTKYKGRKCEDKGKMEGKKVK